MKFISGIREIELIRDDLVIRAFEEYYECRPDWLSSAPGRVNLIGEHTDYNGGFVLPAAINLQIKIGCHLRGDEFLNLYSGYHNESASFSLSSRLRPLGEKGWYSYFLAVVDQFHERGAIVPGMDVMIFGDVPIGAGLASSAAYEVGTAAMINAICKTGLSLKEIALLSQKAEYSDFIGVKCGIMDQFISSMAKREHALLIDCHSSEVKPVPFDSDQAKIIIIDTMKKRGLVDSEYNQRRRECEEGFQVILEASEESFPSIRHIPFSIFEKFKDKLSEKQRKRLRHNLSENRRVLDFVDALNQGDFIKAGGLLYQSHESLKKDYEVSCEELDFIVEEAGKIEGVFGCRMTGAGFGGCVLALVRPDKADEFSNTITNQFSHRFHNKPEIYTTTPIDGVKVRFIN